MSQDTNLLAKPNSLGGITHLTCKLNVHDYLNACWVSHEKVVKYILT